MMLLILHLVLGIVAIVIFYLKSGTNFGFWISVIALVMFITHVIQQSLVRARVRRSLEDAFVKGLIEWDEARAAQMEYKTTIPRDELLTIAYNSAQETFKRAIKHPDMIRTEEERIVMLTPPGWRIIALISPVSILVVVVWSLVILFTK